MADLEPDSVAQIRGQNLEFCTKKYYRDQAVIERDPATANFRFHLQSDDFRALYRRNYRERFGIDISISAENNVDNWLNPASDFYKPEIRRAVFHYAARTQREERVKVFIANDEMRDAAWKYCHHKQLILDGTFGLCDSRMLLWIAMGVDESNSGIPVALFLFSAPTGTQATHAGYNTAIIKELLQHWRDWLGSSPSVHLSTSAGLRVDPGSTVPEPPPAEGPFEPFAAITDTDIKERAALIQVWPQIVLLLCKFHVRQCWTNKRSTIMRRVSGIWQQRVEARLRALEEAYVRAAVCV